MDDDSSQAKQLTGYSFLVVFANDDTIDEGELKMLERIALKDHKVDDQEREVLKGIFSRISKEKVTDAVWGEIESFKHQHEIK